MFLELTVLRFTFFSMELEWRALHFDSVLDAWPLHGDASRAGPSASKDPCVSQIAGNCRAVTPERFGRFAFLWAILHRQAVFRFTAHYS
jgi:hypothetical protein